MGSNVDALFAAIEKSPDDIASYLVLADALQQQGDPRGEAIHLHHRIASTRGPDRDDLVLRERELLNARREKLLGTLAGSPHVELGLRLGLLERLKVAAPLAPDDMGRAVAGVLGSDESRLLRELAFDPGDSGRVIDFPDPDLEDDELGAHAFEEGPRPAEYPIRTALEVIAKSKARPPASLHTLRLGEAFARDPGIRSFNDYNVYSFDDDLSQLLLIFDRIRDLRVDLGLAMLTWAPLVSDHLERFDWISPFIHDDHIAPLTKSKLPALRAFSVWAGAQYLTNEVGDLYEGGLDGLDEEQSLSEESFAAIFAMLDHCSQLSELGLPNCASGVADVLRDLAAHTFVNQLAVFDLSHCELDDEAVAALASLIAKAPKLRELRLDGSVIDAGGRARLHAPELTIVGKPARSMRRRYRYLVTQE